MRSYSDLIVFIVTVLTANLLWKLSVHGLDVPGAAVTLLGWDVTPPFAWLAKRITDESYWLIHLVRDTCVRVADDTFYFPTSFTTRIVYSCTPIKQCFIWLCIMLTTRGGWWHKLWYVPLGWVCAYGFNILRIVSIALLTEFHPSWFYFLHTWLFKYLFYGVLFLLWVFFVERLRHKSVERKENRE